jgi:hypothetical protein
MEKTYGNVDVSPHDTEELVDPRPEESLHRDLRARQISMIAVRAHCAA